MRETNSTLTHPDAALPAREAFLDALLDTDRLAARRVLESASQPYGLGHALDSLMMPVLETVGKRWESGELALAQVYMSGRICEELIDSLMPDNGGNGADSPPLVAIATLEDQHALGKRIVLSMLRAGNIPVRDYGLGLGVEELVERSRADGIRVLLVSTLMLRSALRVKDLVRALAAAHLAVKVAVGGAPFMFDRRLADEVGAAAVGYSASDAPAIVRRLLGDEQ
jgi:methanogenic corrinoid protein MtbC1